MEKITFENDRNYIYGKRNDKIVFTGEAYSLSLNSADEAEIIAYVSKACNNYDLLLNALKLYMEAEIEYHGMLPVVLRPVTKAIKEAIEKTKQ